VRKLLLLFFAIFQLQLSAQVSSPTCQTAQPFCTGSTYTFPASTNAGAAQPGAAYGCLGSQPNPAWYYLQIAQGGNIDIYMYSTPLFDIDFIMWGPFTSPTGPCVAGLTASTIVDCSFLPAPQETANIVNALPGQYYLLLITNFSNQPCDITFSQTNAGAVNAGTTNCNLLTCNIDNVTTQVGNCIPSSSTYSLSGFVDYIYPPSTGNLEVNDSSFSNQNSQIIPTPWGAPQSYNLTGLIADGEIHHVFINFSETDSCNYYLTYQAPQGCCNATATSNGPVCIGDTIKLSVNQTPNASYTWTGPDGFTSNLRTPKIADAQTFKVGWYKIFMDIGHCNDTDSVFVGLKAQPNLYGLDATVCRGNTVNLFAGGAFSYKWPNGDLDSATIMQPDSSQFVPIIGFTNQGCRDTIEIFVEVYDLPNLSITAQDTAFCIGNSTKVNISGAQSYLWGPANILNTITGNQVNASPTVTTNVFVTGTSSNGCVADTNITLTVYSLPILSVIADKNPICYGTEARLSVNGAATYKWSPAATLSIDTGDVVYAGPLNDQTYTVVGTSIYNCKSSKNITVNVNPPISAELQDTIETCFGEASSSVEVIASGGGSFVFEFDWSPKDKLNTANDAFASFSPDTSQYFKVIVSDACGTIPSIDSIFVKVNPLPLVSINADTIVCPGEELRLFNASPNYTSCNWNFGNGKSSSTCDNVRTTYPKTGIYNVYLTIIDNKGCENSNDNPYVIDVKSNPIADFYYTPEIPDVLNKQVALISASSSDVVSWLWNIENTGAFYDSIAFMNFTRAGEYYAELTVENEFGCFDKISKRVKVADIIDFYIPNAFTPNGDNKNDLFGPVGPNIIDGMFTFSIFARTGQLIYQTSSIYKPWDGKINGSKAPMDVYVWKLNFKNELGQMIDSQGTVTLYE